MIERLGRRGLVLALFGVAWMIQGLALVLLGGMESGDATNPIVHERLPDVALAGLWISSGMGAASNAFRKRRESDAVGFMAVSGMPLLLTGSYGVSGLTAAATGSWSVALLGLLGFSIWGVVFGALSLVASWPEPPRTKGGPG